MYLLATPKRNAGGEDGKLAATMFAVSGTERAALLTLATRAFHRLRRRTHDLVPIRVLGPTQEDRNDATFRIEDQLGRPTAMSIRKGG